MGADEGKKVKIRFKFRSGEEFEAEGSPDFIEKQRADFLFLIGKEKKIGHKEQASFPFTAAFSAEREQDSHKGEKGDGDSFYVPRKEDFKSEQAPQELSLPASTRRSPLYQTAASSGAFPFAQPSVYPPHSAVHITNMNGAEELRLWEEISKTEDGHVFLRRKSRLLTPDTAALLLLGAAKMLLKVPHCSALALAKSLAKSGYGGGRLDRVLAGEIKRGSIQAAGSKRSRTYSLSDEGFARAFVLAGKLAEEWR